MKLSAIAAAIGLFALSAAAPALAKNEPPRIPSAAAIDAEIARGMAATGAKGLALAVIDKGRIVHVKTMVCAMLGAIRSGPTPLCMERR